MGNVSIRNSDWVEDEYKKISEMVNCDDFNKLFGQNTSSDMETLNRKIKIINAIKRVTLISGIEQIERLDGSYKNHIGQDVKRTIYLIGEHHGTKLCEDLKIINSSPLFFNVTKFSITEFYRDIFYANNKRDNKKSTFIDFFIEEAKEAPDSKNCKKIECHLINIVKEFKDNIQSNKYDKFNRNNRIHWTDLRYGQASNIKSRWLFYNFFVQFCLYKQSGKFKTPKGNGITIVKKFIDTIKENDFQKKFNITPGALLLYIYNFGRIISFRQHPSILDDEKTCESICRNLLCNWFEDHPYFGVQGKFRDVIHGYDITILNKFYNWIAKSFSGSIQESKETTNFYKDIQNYSNGINECYSKEKMDNITFITDVLGMYKKFMNRYNHQEGLSYMFF